MTSLKTVPASPTSADEAGGKWRSAAAALRWDIRPFIDGRLRDSASAEFFDNIDPATETALCQVAVGDVTDVDAAVRVARQRFEQGSWSELPPVRRQQVLLKLADLLAEHGEELALLDCMEMGKPIQAALWDATDFAPRMLRSWAGFADKLVGTTAPLSSGTLYFNTYQPRGVVGAITPWNFPLVCAIYKCGPALAAGNTIVLKPSELSSGSALRLAELALEAGMPEGVLNVVPGLGTTVGEALASHPDVDLLSFTGSTATGRRIMELAGRSNGKPLLLEMGGKSPTVVFDDVEDLGAVATGALHTVLWNSGQVCSAHSRLIVHEGVKDALLEQVVNRASAQTPAEPLEETTTWGPLASPGQRDRVKRYVEAGVAAGAEAVLLGAIQETGGCFVEPTVFDRVDPAMSILREEIFGPVLCVQSFASEEEALELANATEYGLSSTVWTRDLGRAKRFAHRVRAGGVSIRTSGEEGPDSGSVLSHEPQKASGFGSEFGLRGLQSYSTLKVITMKGA